MPDIDEAVLLHQSGRLEEAAGIYREVLRTNPDDYSALYLLGVISHQQQDENSAIEGSFDLQGPLQACTGVTRGNPRYSGCRRPQSRPPISLTPCAVSARC